MASQKNYEPNASKIVNAYDKDASSSCVTHLYSPRCEQCQSLIRGIFSVLGRVVSKISEIVSRLSVNCSARGRCIYVPRLINNREVASLVIATESS